jgi:hypothetical protein
LVCQNPVRYVVSNFTCQKHTSLCENLKCGFTRIDLDNIKVSFGCDLKVVLNKVEVNEVVSSGKLNREKTKMNIEFQVVIKKHQKVAKNKWLQVGVVSYDLCDYLNGADVPLFKIFLSSFFDSVDPSILHPCPYTVSVCLNPK